MMMKVFKEYKSILLLLGVTLLTFYPVLLGEQAFYYRDLSTLVYPLKWFLVDNFLKSGLPFWNPTAFNGVPFAGLLYPGIFYPPNLLLFLGDFTTGFNNFYIFHFVLLTFSTYALSRFWRMSQTAAVCTALTALLGGFFLSTLTTYVYFLSLAWFPAIFYFLQKFILQRKKRHLALAAICLACQILGGSPEINVMTVLILWAHTTLVLPGGSVKEFFRRTAIGVACVLLALGLSAHQLIPTYYTTLESNRAGGIEFDHHTHWSMQPATLWRILTPPKHAGSMQLQGTPDFDLFQDFHMGLFATLALFSIILFFRRRTFLFWWIVFATGLFFSLGRFNPLYEPLFDINPLMRIFRFPEKYYFICAVSQVFLVGYFIDALRARLNPRAVKIGKIVLATLALLLIASRWLTPSGPLVLPLVCLGTFALAYFLHLTGKLKRKPYLASLVFLVFIDLWVKNYGLIPTTHRSFYDSTPPVAEFIQQQKGLFRVYTGHLYDKPNTLLLDREYDRKTIQYILNERLWPYRGIVHGVNYANGFYGAGLEVKAPMLWKEIFEKSPPDKRLRILERSNVKYWIVGDDPGALPADIELEHDGQVAVLNNALERAFLVGQYRIVPGLVKLNTYFDEAFDPTQEVLVEGPAPFAPAENFQGQVVSMKYEPDHVVITTRQNAPGMLVLLDTFFPGWHATVDGKPVHIQRANHFFRGVPLESGIHTIEFKYLAPGYLPGLGVFTVTLFIVFRLVFIRPRPKAKKPEPEPKKETDPWEHPLLAENVKDQL